MSPVLKRPEPVRFVDAHQSVRARGFAAVLVMAVALLLASLPKGAVNWGGMLEIDSAPYSSFVAGVVALLAVAFAARMAWTSGSRLGYGRPIGFMMGLLVGAVAGDQARAFLELAVLRGGWWHAVEVGGPGALFAVAWMMLAGVIAVVGLVGGAVLALLTLAPRSLRDRLPLVDRLQDTVGLIVSWLPAAWS